MINFADAVVFLGQTQFTMEVRTEDNSTHTRAFPMEAAAIVLSVLAPI
jgi:hypothetical protein